MRASITEGVQDMAVTSGELARLSCSAVGSELDIQWTVDGIKYEKCPSQGEADICFENSYMSDTVTTRSTLIIKDSSSLAVGNHTVQCIVQQNLDSHFGAEMFNESRTTFLRIQGKGSFILHFFPFSEISGVCVCVCVCVCV